MTFQSPETGIVRYPLVALDNITKYAMFSTQADVCFDQKIKKPETVDQPVKPATLTKSIQTDYRETETQTRPWTPPYAVTGRKTPEVLSLACLSWGICIYMISLWYIMLNMYGSLLIKQWPCVILNNNYGKHSFVSAFNTVMSIEKLMIRHIHHQTSQTNFPKFEFS